MKIIRIMVETLLLSFKTEYFKVKCHCNMSNSVMNPNLSPKIY